MNYYEKPTRQQEQAAVEVKTAFEKHLSQFKASCDAVQDIERNLPPIANEALKTAFLSRNQGKIIQTDDGTQWQHNLDLSQISSICHRRVAGKIEFAIIECLLHWLRQEGAWRDAYRQASFAPPTRGG